VSIAERLLAPFASEKQRSGWRGWLWLGLLVLAPLAYAAAMMLGSRLPAGGIKFIRPAEAVERARRVAGELGLPAGTWKDMVIASCDRGLTTYFDDERFRRLPAAWKRWTPYCEIRVTLTGARREHWARVWMTPDGGLNGFQIAEALAGPARTLTEEEARQLAREGVAKWLRPPAELLAAPAELLPGDTPETRRLQWQANVPGLPEFDVKFKADARGDRLTRVQVNYSVDSAVVAQRAGRATGITGPLRGALFLFMAIYGAFGFARRAREGEVAWLRCGVLFGGALGLTTLLLLSHPALYQSAIEPGKAQFGTLVLLLVSYMVGYAIQGVMLALGYGGSEGEMREIYPEKLTSLDALLTGRWFSRPVGAAVIAGIAMAGWALLLQLAGEQAFASRIPRFALGDVNYSYTGNGWFPLMVNQALRALFVGTFTLMIPLVMVNRNVAARRWRLPALVLIGLGGARIGVSLDNGLVPWTLAFTVLLGTVVLVAFRLGDLLAAMVAANLLLLGHSVSMLGPLGGDWPAMERIIVGATVATAAWAFAAMVRGAELTDEMVRPKYAQRILERLGLQAEASTAREAQLRLAPAAPPEIPGLQVAASCTPAREVGGDFYDFFPLSRGRLGVLVAEGGSSGLASALSIGLAKGFLLYAAERDWTAPEALRRLRPVLQRAVKGNIDRLGLAYVIFDPAGPVRMARFGEYPKLLELRPGEAPREIELLGVTGEEYVGEGRAALDEQTMVLAVTNGLVEGLRRVHPAGLLDWLKGKQVRSVAEMHAALKNSAGAALDLTDDITLVLVQRVARPAVRKEGVA